MDDYHIYGHEGERNWIICVRTLSAGREATLNTGALWKWVIDNRDTTYGLSMTDLANLLKRMFVGRMDLRGKKKNVRKVSF